MRHLKPVISESSNGSGKASLSVLFVSCLKTSMNAAASISAMRLLTAASHRQKRGFAIGRTRLREGTKIKAVADAAGFPIAAHVESVPPHEVN